MADNYKWFSNLIRDRKYSQRELAKRLEMDPSSLSLLLHGKRRMRVEQASEIANALGVPVADVMRHGGASNVPTAGNDSRVNAPLPLVGWADGDSRVTLDWSRTEPTVAIPGAFPAGACAIQWRSAQTAAEVFDGWIAVVLPPIEADAEDMIDRFCLVGIKGASVPVVRKVRRGYTPGHYTLINHFGEPTHDVELAWYSPILAMKPV
jgi:transcriptional regulator with XRE-family HTH domain